MNWIIAAFVGGIVLGVAAGFAIACVQFSRMQEDFVNIFSKSPEK